MVQITWRLNFKEIFRRIRDEYSRKVNEFRLCVRSLSYNEHMGYNYVIDCLLEPFVWFVDNFAKSLGTVFVFCVVVLTSAVVSIAYWLGLPYWWERDPYVTVFLVIFGHWLLLNITFHYYMGVNTSPGFPPHGTMIPEVASICKKCISPKPPRTHHCSVCDRCVLGMDHHCPWMNNCIGFYNARYFYMYMVYMVAGVMFLMLGGLHLAYVVLWLEDTGGVSDHPDPDLIGYPVKLNNSGILVPVKILEYDSIISPRDHDLPIPQLTEAHRIAADPWKRRAIKFMAFICVGVCLSLGVLCVMHYKNISRGESSIEAHVNQKLRKTSGSFSFRHPYNFGRKKNWLLFLGLVQGRTVMRHVLLPSAHKPIGNGLTWHTIHNAIDDWP